MVNNYITEDKKIKYTHCIHRTNDLNTLDEYINGLVEKGYTPKSTSMVYNSTLKTYEFVILTEYQEDKN